VVGAAGGRTSSSLA